MSMFPSIVAVTERSWMPRCWAMAATPAVRQLASPTSTYSTGVAPLSSDANTSVLSASNLNVVLRRCSSPRPKNPSTVEWLWVPFFHSQDARHLNCAAWGALVSASRAAIKASTFTPLLTATLVPAIALSFMILLMITTPRLWRVRVPPAQNETTLRRQRTGLVAAPPDLVSRAAASVQRKTEKNWRAAGPILQPG